MAGKHLLKEQVDLHAFFAGVYLDVESMGPSIRCDAEVGFAERALADLHEEEWRSGIAWGIDYACRRALSVESFKKWKVTITDVRCMDVDSGKWTFAFASAFAFWDALSIKPEDPPYLDRDQRKLIFPE